MAAVRDVHRPPRRVRSRPARTTASWADLLIASAATAAVMGGVILIAAFAGGNVAGGDAGLFWAIAFAGGLGLTALFLALLGLGLLGERARPAGRHLVPVACGAAAGVLIGALALDGASREAVLAPLLLLLLALPPVRAAIARIRRQRSGGSSQ